MTVGPSITTITFFEGLKTPAETHLKNKLKAILLLNPWLMGSLKRKGSDLVIH